MSQNLISHDRIAEALRPYGLVPRGCHVFSGQEPAPDVREGTPAHCVVLIGHAGSTIWPHFENWRETHGEMTDPLDQWSKEIVGAVAANLQARAVFPSDRPFLPFQQWAMRAENLKSSPVGLLIHPEFGLWHAYRGALLFEDAVEMPASGTPGHPCDTCETKPCLKACPVDAFNTGLYDVKACRDYLATDAGEDCLLKGCKARLACPVGRQHAYNPAQMRFHMAAFAGS